MQKQYANIFLSFYSAVMTNHSFSQLYKHSLQRHLRNELTNTSDQQGSAQQQEQQQTLIRHELSDEKQQDFVKIRKQVSSHNLYEIIYFYLFYRHVNQNRFGQLRMFVERIRSNLKKITKGLEEEINRIIANKINKFSQYLLHFQTKILRSSKIDHLYVEFFYQFQSSLYSFTEVLCSREAALQPMKNIKKQNYGVLMKLLNVKCFIAQWEARKKLSYGDGQYHIYIGYRQQKYSIITEKQYYRLFKNKSQNQEKASSKGSAEASSQNTRSLVSEIKIQKSKAKQLFLSELAKNQALQQRNSELISMMAQFKDSIAKTRNNQL